MLTRTRRIATAALAVAAMGAQPAVAMPSEPTGGTGNSIVPMGEHAASLNGLEPSAATPQRELGDLRTESAQEPFQPVVVEVEEQVASGFDWSAAGIGAAGGLALVLIGGAAVAVARHRPARTMPS
jgi:hypothetical protein